MLAKILIPKEPSSINHVMYGVLIFFDYHVLNMALIAIRPIIWNSKVRTLDTQIVYLDTNSR